MAARTKTRRRNPPVYQIPDTIDEFMQLTDPRRRNKDGRVRRTRRQVPQAVFFDPRAWTPASARAWMREKKYPKPKGNMKRGGPGVPAGWFGWEFKSIPKGSRVRFVPFGTTIRARFAFKGRKPAKRKPAKRKPARRNAGRDEAIYTWALISDQAGAIEARTVAEARKKLRKRLGLIKLPPRVPVRRLTKKQVVQIASDVERTGRAPGFLVAQATEVMGILQRRARKKTPAPRKKMRGIRFSDQIEAARVRYLDEIEKRKGQGFKMSPLERIVIAQFGVVGAVSSKRIVVDLISTGLNAAEATAAAKRAEALRQGRARLNPKLKPLARAKQRRAEFLADGTKAADVNVSAIKLRGSRTIPAKGLIMVGHYRQINYVAAKFNKGLAEYFHRPKGFGREGAKLSDDSGGVVLLHPDGDYLLVVPGTAQGRKFRMDYRGLLD